ncbi:MAG TPA: hypothetical protein VKN99_08105 [Polyangia bacterium]|nr:hypothetical protein [Polyangia bacterium]
MPDEIEEVEPPAEQAQKAAEPQQSHRLGRQRRRGSASAEHGKDQRHHAQRGRAERAANRSAVEPPEGEPTADGNSHQCQDAQGAAKIHGGRHCNRETSVDLFVFTLVAVEELTLLV